jgi:glucan 1,3-beta-glucosidase
VVASAQTSYSWPFYENATSYCLDIYNPIQGDQNLPSFPGYANNIANIDITLVQPKVKNETSAIQGNGTGLSSTTEPASAVPSSSTAIIAVAGASTSTSAGSGGSTSGTIPRTGVENGLIVLALTAGPLGFLSL